MCSAPLIGLSRHRLLTDGEGVTTLVAFHGCTLRCRYCLNPQCLSDDTPCRLCTPQELYEEVRQDELYFLATRGGVTFGGGEPLMRSRFIEEFRRLCGPLWRINVETSLNVPTQHVQRLLTVADHFIIDIKDLDPDRYRRYTGRDNTRVLGNLRLLLRRIASGGQNQGDFFLLTKGQQAVQGSGRGKINQDVRLTRELGGSGVNGEVPVTGAQHIKAGHHLDP